MSNGEELSIEAERSQRESRSRIYWAVEIADPTARIDRLETRSDHWVRGTIDGGDELLMIALDPAVDADAAKEYSTRL